MTGASAGIGAELARELARRGHHLTLVARRRDRLEHLAAELGTEAEIEARDLAVPEERAQLVAALSEGDREVVGRFPGTRPTRRARRS